MLLLISAPKQASFASWSFAGAGGYRLFTEPLSLNDPRRSWVPFLETHDNNQNPKMMYQEPGDKTHML